MTTYQQQVFESTAGPSTRSTVPVRLPHVGIVVCTRNKPRQLRSALACISAQDYHNVTVVLVDDMSECEAENVRAARSFQGDLRYIRNDHSLGISRTRNRGMNHMITHVRPEFICTLDDDDQWPSFRLQAGVDAMQSPDVGMSYGTQYMSDTYLQPILRYPCRTSFTRAKLHALFCGEFFFPAKTYMFRREFLEEIPLGPSDWYMPHNSREDVELGIRSLRHSTTSGKWRIVFIDRLLAFWIQADGLAKFSSREHLQRLFAAHAFLVREYLPKWTHRTAIKTAPFLYRLPHCVRFAIV